MWRSSASRSVSTEWTDALWLWDLALSFAPCGATSAAAANACVCSADTPVQIRMMIRSKEMPATSRLCDNVERASDTGRKTRDMHEADEKYARCQ